MEKLQIGEIIRALRKNKGVTQEQLAEILDVSTPAISKWESGQTNPDISMLPVIARYFQVTIDFLLGFSSELSADAVKAICDDVIQKFNHLPFEDAQKEWLEHLRQHPTQYSFRYELATIGIMQLSKARSAEDMMGFVNRLITVFQQCTSSDDLKIKQGSYFQMANLYIVLQDFEKAQEVLNRIPTQMVNPRILLSMILIRKNDYAQANRNIQENIYRTVIDITGELANAVSVRRMSQGDNQNDILALYDKQWGIFILFGLEAIHGFGNRLQAALLPSQIGEVTQALHELEKGTILLEKHPLNSVSIQDIPFFQDVDIPKQKYSGLSFPSDAYLDLIEQGFSNMKGDARFESIKKRLELSLRGKEE